STTRYLRSTPNPLRCRNSWTSPPTRAKNMTAPYPSRPGSSAWTPNSRAGLKTSRPTGCGLRRPPATGTVEPLGGLRRESAVDQVGERYVSEDRAQRGAHRDPEADVGIDLVVAQFMWADPPNRDERTVEGTDHVSHGDVIARTGEQPAAAWAPAALRE